jgi:hypothetical protein
MYEYHELATNCLDSEELNFPLQPAYPDTIYDMMNDVVLLSLNFNDS